MAKKCYKKIKGKWYSQEQLDRIQKWNEELKELEAQNATKSSKKRNEKIDKLKGKIGASVKGGLPNPFDNSGNLDIETIFDPIEGVTEFDRSPKEIALNKLIVWKNSLRQLGVTAVDVYNSYKTEFDKNNISLSEIVEAMQVRGDVPSPGRERDLVDFTPPKTLVGKGYRTTKRWIISQLNSKGYTRFFPPLYEAKRRKEKLILATKQKVDRLNISLENVIKKAKLDEAQQEAITEFLTRERTSLAGIGLSPVVQTRIEGLTRLIRLELDVLSSQIQDVLGDSFKVELVEGNKGEYLTRIYEVFTNPDWVNKVQGMPEVMQGARRVFRRNINGWLDRNDKRIAKLEKKLDEKSENYEADDNKREEIENELENLKKENVEFRQAQSSDQALTDFIINNYLASKQEQVANIEPQNPKGKLKEDVFKKRGEIPSEIRALLGEVKDPVRAVSGAVSLMAQNYTNKELQRVTGEYIKANGLYSNKFDEEKGHTLKVPLGKETHKELRKVLGLDSKKDHIFVPPEMKDFFEIRNTAIEKFFDSAVGKGIAGPIQQINSMFKIFQTVYNVGTQKLNVIGNIPFMIRLGALTNPILTTKAISESISILVSQDFNRLISRDAKLSPEQRQVLDILTENGVLNSNLSIELINELAGKTPWAKKLRKKAENVSPTLTNITLSPLDLAKWTYALGDNVYKVAQFLVEVNNLTDAYTDGKVKDFYSLNDAELKKQIIKEATDVVRGGLPNYGEIYRGLRTIQKIPLIGPFVSYQGEVIRTTVKTFQIAAEQILSKNPKVRKMGMEKMIASNIVNAATAFTTSLIWAFLSNASDDEQEYIYDYIVADYEKDVIITNLGEGFYKFENVEAKNGLAYIAAPFSPLIRHAAGRSNLSLWENASKSFKAFFEPYIGVESGAQILFNAANIEDRFGREYLNYMEFLSNELPQGTVRAVIKVMDRQDQYLAAKRRLDAIQDKRIANNTEVTQAEKNALKRVELLAKRYKDARSSLVGVRERHVYMPTEINFLFKKKYAEAKEGMEKYNNGRAGYSPIEAEKAYTTANKNYQEKMREIKRIYQKSIIAFPEIRKEIHEVVKEGKYSFSSGYIESKKDRSTFSKKEKDYILGNTLKVPELPSTDVELRKLLAQ